MEKEDPAVETRERRWFAVAGVAVLLSAIVLLAPYLDQSARSPAINFALLFGASAIMLGAGLVLEKWTQLWPARALVAGGLASLYFTAFAGYYFRHLRLVDHPVAGCVMTVAAAILIVLIAEKRQAHATTFFVVILSGYTTAFQPVLWFTLFSDVVIVAIACWLLVRHGWIVLTFVTLVASYLSYAMWWSYHEGRLDFARYLQLHEFWQTCLFFAGCWLIVVVATFLTPRDKLAPATRLILLSLNHALFFSLVVFVLPPMGAAWILSFSVGIGVAMIAAGALISRREPSIWRPAFQQGALVIMLGLFTAVAGPHFVLIVAIVSALLLVTGRALDDRWGGALRFVAGVVALVSFLMALGPVCELAPVGRVIGVITGLILIGDACLARRPAASRSEIDWHAVYFAALGMALWLITIIYQFPQIGQPPLLAVIALAFTISMVVLRVPELPYLAKGLVLAALVLWLAQLGSFDRPWWNPLVRNPHHPFPEPMVAESRCTPDPKVGTNPRARSGCLGRGGDSLLLARRKPDSSLVAHASFSTIGRHVRLRNLDARLGRRRAGTNIHFCQSLRILRATRAKPLAITARRAHAGGDASRARGRQ